jgi:hypothetical protein
LTSIARLLGSSREAGGSASCAPKRFGGGA